MDDKGAALEKYVILVAISAFLVLSAMFLVSALLAKDMVSMYWRVGLGVCCFVFAVILFAMSPSNQGRMIREFLPLLNKPIQAKEIEKLQLTVGSAGFFNRIGLTGIPLAVALLACVLYALVFVATRLGGEYQKAAEPFMDLAKLTTGAFIGALSSSRKSPPGTSA
jgi:hypothetical protein